MIVIQQKRKKLDPKTGRMVEVWAKMASHPGDVETAAKHADAAYSGHLRVFEGAELAWERRSEDPVGDLFEEFTAEDE